MALTTGNEDQLSTAKDDKDVLFVGQWVAPFLLLGIYSKIAITERHN